MDKIVELCTASTAHQDWVLIIDGMHIRSGICYRAAASVEWSRCYGAELVAKWAWYTIVTSFPNHVDLHAHVTTQCILNLPRPTPCLVFGDICFLQMWTMPRADPERWTRWIATPLILKASFFATKSTIALRLRRLISSS